MLSPWTACSKSESHATRHPSAPTAVDSTANGWKAPKSASVIHNDFERGFIRAETIAYADYIACKGESGAREAGKLRQEGKEYVVQDGDVFHFKFNV